MSWRASESDWFFNNTIAPLTLSQHPHGQYLYSEVFMHQPSRNSMSSREDFSVFQSFCAQVMVDGAPVVARCGITDWIRPGAEHETWKRFFLITPQHPESSHNSGEFDEKQFRNVEPALK